MRAFLSHSSVDKVIVIGVHKGLETESTWLDRAEIEWGDLFLEKITEGIASATDFVLFWSKHASKSEWVRLEVNMAFIQALRRKAIRLRVVTLDDTPLPLYLEGYQVFSVVGSTSPVSDIVQKLKVILKETPRSVRSRFVNRHDEIAKIEKAVDDPEFRAVCAFGFTGVGKTSTIQEALQRIFEGANVVRIDVGEGTGFVELALALSASVLHEPLPEALPQEQLDERIRLCVETIVKNGQMLVLANVQHWLDEDSQPQGPLTSLLSIVSNLPALASRPIFMTSTRRPKLDASITGRLMLFHIGGLKDEYIAALVRNWYFAIYDKELSVEDSSRIAPKLYGHPVAARLVAGLLGNHSVDFLDQYPEELVALRRDLARVLLQDLKLSPEAERLMETLALAGVGLPASVLVAAGSSEAEFQQAVAQCANAGLITADTVIETHPLFQEFYWHRLHRSDYRQRSLNLAEALRIRLDDVDKTSPEFASLLPVIFRSYALAGELEKATALRRDLQTTVCASGPGFSRLRVQPTNLLPAGMEITSHNHHAKAPSVQKPWSSTVDYRFRIEPSLLSNQSKLCLGGGFHRATATVASARTERSRENSISLLATSCAIRSKSKSPPKQSLGGAPFRVGMVEWSASFASKKPVLSCAQRHHRESSLTDQR